MRNHAFCRFARPLPRLALVVIPDTSCEDPPTLGFAGSGAESSEVSVSLQRSNKLCQYDIRRHNGFAGRTISSSDVAPLQAHHCSLLSLVRDAIYRLVHYIRPASRSLSPDVASPLQLPSSAFSQPRLVPSLPPPLAFSSLLQTASSLSTTPRAYSSTPKSSAIGGLHWPCSERRSRL